MSRLSTNLLIAALLFNFAAPALAVEDPQEQFKQQLTSEVDTCTAAISKSPKDPSNYEARAWLYHQQGQYDKALADYTRAIEIIQGNAGPFSPQTTSSAAFFGRATTHSALGKFAESAQDYKRGQEAANSHYSKAFTNMFMQFAMIFLTIGLALVLVSLLSFGPEGALHFLVKKKPTPNSQ